MSETAQPATESTPGDAARDAPSSTLSTPRSSRAGLWPAASTLWRREMVRFFRQRNRVVSALVTPAILWVMISAGLNSAVALPTSEALTESDAAGGVALGYQYFFTGAVTMILLFTAIFSTISVIEDRREGFLQGVLVAPAPRLAIAMGKVLGGATIATIHGAVFLLLWPVVAGVEDWGATLLSMGLSLVAMFVVAMALTGLGLCIAWPMTSTAGFHAIMMVFLMPMWFLSGAVFPLSGAPVWMRVVMWANPLTYGHWTIEGVLSGQYRDSNFAVGAGVTLGFTVVIVALATRLITRPRKDGLA